MIPPLKRRLPPLLEPHAGPHNRPFDRAAFNCGLQLRPSLSGTRRRPWPPLRRRPLPASDERLVRRLRASADPSANGRELSARQVRPTLGYPIPASCSTHSAIPRAIGRVIWVDPIRVARVLERPGPSVRLDTTRFVDGDLFTTRARTCLHRRSRHASSSRPDRRRSTP